MISKIVDVLVKVREKINEENIKEENLENLKLEKLYNQNIVAAAYSWIYEKNQLERAVSKTIPLHQRKGIRIPSDEEIRAIGIKNYDYLFHFYNIGLLTYLEFDYILDELKLLPIESIHLDQINVLLLSLYLNLEKLSLPGSRLMLHSSDTIN
ncbi:MAG TPA: DUF494 family protein [Ignavibacteria bacterium]|nr:DUF494 family protein [Ignavibacteria bacterium]